MLEQIGQNFGFSGFARQPSIHQTQGTLLTTEPLAHLITTQVFANLASGMRPLKIVEIVVKIVATALRYPFKAAMKRHFIAPSRSNR